MNSSNAKANSGYLYGFTAYFIWGIFPFYFKSLDNIPSTEIVLHRIIWSVIVGWIMLQFWRHSGWWQQLLAHPRRIAILFFTGILISGNWLVYVWAVNHGRILDASLGYYMNPLVSVTLGVLILGERLRPLQWVAVAIAAISVALQLWLHGSLPIISLLLAFSFSIYGLIRKITPIAVLPGTVIESSLIAPIALIWLFFLPQATTTNIAFWGSYQSFLLAMAGIVTILPLMAFNLAAQRLPYAVIGFMQYIAPTMLLIWAIFIYHEQFSTAKILAFALIWLSLLLYSYDLYRHWRSKRS